MKVCFISLLIFCTANLCSAQVFKNLGKQIKGDAEWRVRYKTDQNINKGLDSLLVLPKKIKGKKKSTAKSNNPNTLHPE